MPATRRQDAAAHRGHRPRALDRGGDRRHPRRADWLGLDWDGEPSISSRARRATARSPRSCSPRARPIAATRRRKNSTRCATTAARRRAPPRYDGRWRDRDPSEAPSGVKPVVRLKAPRERRNGDRRQSAGPGRLVANEDLDDFVLLRSEARRPTCSRWWWTITTWASPMSFAATTISPMPARQIQIYQAHGLGRAGLWRMCR